jgi:hypothetical protein
MGAKVWLLIGIITLLQGCTYYFSNSWKKSFSAGGDRPYLTMGSRPAPMSDSLNAVLGAELLQHWAAQTGLYSDWREHGKIGVPRVVLANLMLGQNIDSTNKYLQGLVPWGTLGSTWAFNKNGDYDFTQIILADILMRFRDQPNLLYPATAKHLSSILIPDQGLKTATRTPRTLHLMSDTENHILMREISRYLNLEYRRSQGLTDTSITSLEGWLQRHLEEMLHTGFYEFNGQPYIGYTITALEVLYNHAQNPQIKLLAQQLLDKVHLDYALGSLCLRRYPPYRRRLNYASNTDFGKDPHTAIMQVLLLKYEHKALQIDQLPHARHQSLIAWVSDYQLPDALYQFITQPQLPYLALIGHGKKASPEVYSSGPGFLISAGGVQRGRQSQIVPRPIVLFVNDNAPTLEGTIYLKSQGPLKDWNQTGVYDKFAVSNGGAYVPEVMKPLAASNGWQIISPTEGLLVAIYTKSDIGIMAVYDDWTLNPELLLTQIQDLNPDPELLYQEVRLPNRELIRYNLNSKKDTWVIRPSEESGLSRDFDKWPGLRLIKR